MPENENRTVRQRGRPVSRRSFLKDVALGVASAGAGAVSGGAAGAAAIERRDNGLILFLEQQVEGLTQLAKDQARDLKAVSELSEKESAKIREQSLSEKESAKIREQSLVDLRAALEKSNKEAIASTEKVEAERKELSGRLGERLKADETKRERLMVGEIQVFEENGFGEFTGVYIKCCEMERLFGACPSDFLNILRIGKVLSLDTEEAVKTVRGEELINSGWQSLDLGQTIERATKYVNEVLVKGMELSGEAKMSPDQFGNSKRALIGLLNEAAGKFPLLVLVLPPKMYVVEGGGSCGLDFCHLSYIGSRKHDWVLFLHESGHAFDNMLWHEATLKRMKSCLSKEIFAGYAEKYADTICTVLKTWLGMPEKEAMSVKNGDPLLALNAGKDEIKAWEVCFGFMDKRIAGVEDLWRKYNLLVFTVGQRLLKMDDKERNDFFKSYPQTKTLMQSALNEIGHFFVGPLQADEGGLPQGNYEVSSGLLNDYNAALQRIRLGLVSTLPAGYTHNRIFKALKC